MNLWMIAVVFWTVHAHEIAVDIAPAVAIAAIAAGVIAEVMTIAVNASVRIFARGF